MRPLLMPKLPLHVYVVDDEPSVRTAYARLLRSAGMESTAFATVEDLLASTLASERACVVSDVRMPGGNALELPELLARSGRKLPVIYTTAHDTDEMREMAQRAGAAAFFRKPVDDQALLDAIIWAVSEAEPTAHHHPAL
jgi:FixJ family two-component response regulator